MNVHRRPQRTTLRASNAASPLATHRDAFSLLEAIVTLAVIGLVLAIAMPALQQAREASRKAQCVGNLRQIGIAIANYETLWRAYPHGMTHKYAILPQLDQQTVFDAVDKSTSDPFVAWKPIEGQTPQVYVCPSEVAPTVVHGLGTTSYAACMGTCPLANGWDGLFNYWPELSRLPGSKVITAADVRDGLSNTVAMSEILHTAMEVSDLRSHWESPDRYGFGQFEEFTAFCESLPPSPDRFGIRPDSSHWGRPWYHGNCGWGMYNHALPPNRPSCKNQTNMTTGIFTAGSMHIGGVNVLFADGHVEFCSESIDRGIWREYGSRADMPMIPPVEE